MNIVTITQAIIFTLLSIMWITLAVSCLEVAYGERVLNLGVAKKTLDNSPHS